MKLVAIIASLMLLSACGNSERLATCKGPMFTLNPTHWNAQPADLEWTKMGSNNE